MLAANGEDVKTVQSLLRHANPSITTGIYTHAVTAKKGEAPCLVGHGVAGNNKSTADICGARRYSLIFTVLVYHAFFTVLGKLLERNGGDDGTRTRGLCRDRAAF